MRRSRQNDGFHPERRAALAGIAGLGLAALAGEARSQIVVSPRTDVAPIGLTRTMLESHVNEDGSEFAMILDIFPPGIVVPAHRHSAVGFSYVVSGEGESQYEGQPLIRFGPGDTFQDMPGPRHLLFRNLSHTKPLIVVLAYTMPKGRPFFLAE
jgi:quercetin dioxygenase-like cupin family protein